MRFPMDSIMYVGARCSRASRSAPPRGSNARGSRAIHSPSTPFQSHKGLPTPPFNLTRDCPPSLLISQGITHTPFHKGLPTLPSNLTREYPSGAFFAVRAAVAFPASCRAADAPFFWPQAYMRPYSRGAAACDKHRGFFSGGRISGPFPSAVADRLLSSALSTVIDLVWRDVTLLLVWR